MSHEEVLHKNWNTLLMPVPEGGAKPSYYDLPKKSHAYGKANVAGKWGTKECVNMWIESKPVVLQEERQINYRIYNKIYSQDSFKHSQQFKRSSSLPTLLQDENSPKAKAIRRREARIAKLTADLKSPGRNPHTLAEKEAMYHNTLSKKTPKKTLKNSLSVPDITFGAFPARNFPKVPDNMKKIMEGGYEAESAAQCKELYKMHKIANMKAMKPPLPTAATLGHAQGSLMRRIALQAKKEAEVVEAKAWTLPFFDKRVPNGTMKFMDDGHMECFDSPADLRAHLAKNKK